MAQHSRPLGSYSTSTGNEDHTLGAVISSSKSDNHLLEEVEGESRGEVAGEDEGVEEQPLRRRALLRVLGQCDLHETAKTERDKDI